MNFEREHNDRIPSTVLPTAASGHRLAEEPDGCGGFPCSLLGFTFVPSGRTNGGCLGGDRRARRGEFHWLRPASGRKHDRPHPGFIQEAGGGRAGMGPHNHVANLDPPSPTEATFTQ